MEAERKEKPGCLRRSIIQSHFRPVPSDTCFGNGEVARTDRKWRLHNSFQARATWDGSEVALYNTTPQTARFLFSLRLTPTSYTDSTSSPSPNIGALQDYFGDM